MNEELQQPEPKISEVEIILIGIFYLLLDVFDLIPAVGDLTDVIAAPMGYYYWTKGLNGITFIVAEIIEAIPGPQEFPFIRIITWGITVWIDRHPALEAAVAPALAIEGALEGDVAATEEGVSGKGLSYSAQSADVEASGTTSAREATQAESGFNERQPEADARPSETSAERGSGGENDQVDRRGRTEEGEEGNLPNSGDENPDGDNEEERLEREKEEEAEERYEELVTPEAERNPVDVALKEELGNVVPIDRNRRAAPPPPPPAPRSKSAIEGSISHEQAKLQKAAEVRRQLDSIKAPGEVTRDATDDDIAKAA